MNLCRTTVFCNLQSTLNKGIGGVVYMFVQSSTNYFLYCLIIYTSLIPRIESKSGQWTHLKSNLLSLTQIYRELFWLNLHLVSSNMSYLRDHNTTNRKVCKQSLRKHHHPRFAAIRSLDSSNNYVCQSCGREGLSPPTPYETSVWDDTIRYRDLWIKISNGPPPRAVHQVHQNRPWHLTSHHKCSIGSPHFWYWPQVVIILLVLVICQSSQCWVLWMEGSAMITRDKSV